MWQAETVPVASAQRYLGYSFPTTAGPFVGLTSRPVFGAYFLRRAAVSQDPGCRQLARQNCPRSRTGRHRRDGCHQVVGRRQVAADGARGVVPVSLEGDPPAWRWQARTGAGDELTYWYMDVYS